MNNNSNRPDLRAVQGGTQSVPQPPSEPKQLTPEEEFNQITNFLGQLLTQFTFPKEYIKGDRVESLFNYLRRTVAERLTQEISTGVISSSVEN